MPLFTNRQLWEAWIALERMGEVGLPPFSVGFDLALNRNHLRPVRNAIDEQRLALVATHQVGDEHPKDAGRPQRLAAFRVDWEALLAREVEWAPHGTIKRKQLQDSSEGEAVRVMANDIAALLAIGIIVLDEEPKGPKAVP